jgi:hypothetical protein
VAQSLAADSPFVPGRVYCYWCEATDCAHAAPPSPRVVFAGYTPTGQPSWEDLNSLCLRLSPAQVDLLHRDPPRPVTIFMPGAELTKDQLSVFGASSRAFRVVVQAVVGYLPFGPSDALGRAAITVQVVEAAAGDRPPVLALNIVGRAAGGGDIGEAAATMPDRRLGDLFDRGRRRLRELSVERPGAGREHEIEKALRHVAGGIEKICRQSGRRTKHAQLRHRDPSRPAGAALRDVTQAKAGEFFFDKRRRTCIVLGPHCRAHVFNDEGHHVTSLVFRGEEIEGRIHTRQWEPLDEVAREVARERILRAGERRDDAAAARQ